SLRKIPHGSLRLVVTAASQNPAAGMFVDVFIGPLPDVAHQIHNAERARSTRVCGDAVGTSHVPAFVRRRDDRRVPLVAPWVFALVGSLGVVLPFPLVRQALASPLSIGARIFKRDPSNGLVS